MIKKKLWSTDFWVDLIPQVSFYRAVHATIFVDPDNLLLIPLMFSHDLVPVSYTHLDVYKRQLLFLDIQTFWLAPSVFLTSSHWSTSLCLAMTITLVLSTFILIPLSLMAFPHSVIAFWSSSLDQYNQHRPGLE